MSVGVDIDKCQIYVFFTIIFGTYLTCMLSLLLILTPKIVNLVRFIFYLSNNVNFMYYVFCLCIFFVIVLFIVF